MAKPASIAPVLILVVLLVAAGSAAVWFLVLRPRQTAQLAHNPPEQTASGATPGSGSAAVATTGPATPGSGATPGSAAAIQTGSAAPPASAAPKAELVDTVIGASAGGATVEIIGANQSGPAPFTAKLEKGKPYQARVTAPTFLALTLDFKGGDDKPTAKLAPKPRVISIRTDPPGALIAVDGSGTGHSTPFDVELTEAQAAKKTVRVRVKKSGFVTLDRVIELAKLTEDDTRMVATIDEKLLAQTAVRPGSGAGSAKSPPSGSDSDSGATPEPPAQPSGGSASGGSTTPPTPPPAPPPAPPAGGAAGSAGEPTPSFINNTP